LDSFCRAHFWVSSRTYVLLKSLNEERIDPHGIDGIESLDNFVACK